MGNCVPVVARGTTAKCVRCAEPGPVGVNPRMLGGMYPWNELGCQWPRLHLMDFSDANDMLTGFRVVRLSQRKGMHLLRKREDSHRFEASIRVERYQEHRRRRRRTVGVGTDQVTPMLDAKF